MKKIGVVFLLVLWLLVPMKPWPAQPPVLVNVVSEFQQRELDCLAKNIFYEAAEESHEGQLAVATVTMNRVKSQSFPNTVCGVVYQRGRRGCQFSWTCGPHASMNRTLYQRAKKVAHEVLTNQVRLVSIKNALFYHNLTVAPEWDFAHPIKQIGNHIFYVVNYP